MMHGAIVILCDAEIVIRREGRGGNVLWMTRIFGKEAILCERHLMNVEKVMVRRKN
jgi:hypothetical protein